MVPKKLLFLSLAITLALLAPAAFPARAAASVGGATTELPPLPEWPIIGPIMRMLGLSTTEVEPVAMPTPDPNLPEHRITSLEDMQALDEVALNERVRVIATDEDLNRMILKVLQDADLVEGASLNLDFEPNRVTADLKASATLLDQIDLPVELPALLRGRNINATATMGVEAINCRVNVSFDKVKVNNWSLGLRPLATRTVNERIPDFWSSDICVEAVYLMEGEAAVEGYRR